MDQEYTLARTSVHYMGTIHTYSFMRTGNFAYLHVLGRSEVNLDEIGVGLKSWVFSSDAAVQTTRGRSFQHLDTGTEKSIDAYLLLL